MTAAASASWHRERVLVAPRRGLTILSADLGPSVEREPNVSRILPKLMALTLLLTACSGAETTPDLPKTDGTRHSLLGAPHVSVIVPKGLDVAAPLTWVWQTPDGPILVTVRRQQEPQDGMNAELDREIRKMQEGGDADVMGDRMVPLGDLEGRLVEATTTRKQDPPNSLWLLLCVAEDGMYALTVAGPTVAVKDRRSELLAFMESLRIVSPQPPAPQPAAAVPDLVEPPPAATPTRP